MSQRIKRPNRSEDGFVPVKRRKRMAVEDEEAATLARIYNRNSNEAPAELFRKDLISAMKLPDSEPLSVDEYWIIQDQWKQEWERGVQVPVNPDSLPEPSVSIIRNVRKSANEFKLPKNKYIRITKDENFKVDEHVLSNTPSLAEDACSYDLDESDVAWLKLVNAERSTCGLGPVHEDQLERVMERFEMGCWEKIQTILRNEEGLGIEFDENVICDVCRSPDSEEGNEMVFCDSCNICVHQACYGITRIPEGQWLCCTCNLAIRPKCVLCPNKGGAMKCTRSGQKWAHVSCALWIPEVSIGCVEKMEPITKISSIPTSRWALICVLCRERVGACIQCSVKTCKTAYHVTCAFKHGLEMRAIIEDENADDGVKLRSYCEKHSKSSKKEKSVCSGSEDDDSRKRKRKDMTSEEKNLARAARLQEIESEFYKFVSVKDVSINLNVDQEALTHIYNYWKLKRKSGHNKPLLPPKTEDIEVLVLSPEDIDTEKLKTFVQLRQDLERVRNLCYMVTRREKLSRSLFRLREQTFLKQTAVLESGINLPGAVINAVIEANHGPSIYDRLYSHDEIQVHTKDFELILARIQGLKSPTGSGDEKKVELNGLFKDAESNPYKKVYFNGSKRRSSALYSSMSSRSSSMSSEEKLKENKENRFNSTTDDEKTVSTITSKKSKHKKQINRKMTDRRKKSISTNKGKSESSSEEDIKPIAKKEWCNSTFNRSKLRIVEHQLGLSGTDSDDLMDLRNNRKPLNQKTRISSIYSDSDSSDSMKNDDKSSNANNSDSQQKLRTKASVKEFSNKPSTSKAVNKSSAENKKKTKLEDTKKDDAFKKKDYVPSDLIVPQRQAAKKASENLKNTTTGRPKDIVGLQIDETVKIEEKSKTQKLKVKSRDTKEKIDKPEKVEKCEKSDKCEKLDKSENDKSMHTEISENEKEEKLDSNELLAYVPQRQAAKKAAEHIKSGLGKPVGAADNIPNEFDRMKKDNESSNKSKKDDAKTKKEREIEKPTTFVESKRTSSSISTSSSSSSFSSGSTSSSSSSSDDDNDDDETQKLQSESLLLLSNRDQVKRANVKDRPFLDKGSKSATFSSSASDSGNSTQTSTQKLNVLSSQQTAQSHRPCEPTKIDRSRSPKKSTDKKLLSPAFEREESKPKGRPFRGRPYAPNSSEVRNIDSWTRDLSSSKHISVEKDGTKIRNRKQSMSDEMDQQESSEKTIRSSYILSPIREKDKKLPMSSGAKILSESDKTTSNLEKEILERKASKENKSKSTLDRLFGPIGNTEQSKQEEFKYEKQDKKISEKQAKHERTEKLVDKIFKENQEHPIAKERSPKKSPCKNQNKGIDDLLNSKLITEVKISTEIEPTTENTFEFDNKLCEPNPDESSETKPNERQLIISEVQQLTEKEENIKENSELTISLGNMSRSIFSPQCQTKETDMPDFDNFDDSLEISKDDILRPFTFNTSIVNNDNTREENVRETLNLVEKLRLGLSKKPTGCEIDDTLSIGSNSKTDDRSEFLEQVVPENLNEELLLNTQEVKQEEQPKPMVSLESKVELIQSKMFDGHSQNYQFINCQAEVPIECNKSIPIEQHQGLSDTLTTQGDERWVPPSDQNYSNIPDSSHQNFMTNATQVDSHSFLDQYSANIFDQEHHKKYPEVNNILDVGAHLQNEVMKKQPHLLHGQRISQPIIEGIPDINPNNTKFPELHMHPPNWPDTLLPNRRSSSSSAASSISSISRNNENEEDTNKLRSDMMIVNPPPNIDISLFPSQTLPTFQPNPLEPFATYSEASQFVNPVSLFAGPNLNTQLAYPSAGPTGFPPAFGAPFPTPHVLPPIPKPEENIPYPSACTAAFTSSQHNMALTAAMVNIPAAKEMESSLEESLPPCQGNVDSLHVMPKKDSIAPPQESPIVCSAATSIAESSSVSPTQKSVPGKKSPSKPTRCSARVTSQMMNKSPNKSPGKSPRQELSKHGNASKRDKKGNKGASGKNNQYQGKSRGRGRGRARPPLSVPHVDLDIMGNTNTIQKLVGTVYDLDFDDEWNETADLKSMRERRKSVDIHEKKGGHSLSKDSIESPKFSSPLQNSHKNRSYVDLSNLRPPTPFDDSNNSKESEPTSLKMGDDTPKSAFPDIVPPFLPGPVDMRTYNSSYEEHKYESTNLLQAFATGTTESQVHDGIDEEYEKELHDALMCKEKNEQKNVPEINNIKVSLSDSRNQLKVKIKGPIANYTSNVAPMPPPMVDPIVVTNITSNSVSINVANNANATGTSNLRRMRKKELLRQYWSQDMSTDDPSSIPINNTPADPIVNRTVTIPKAVTSVTSIPTKEDYRDYRTGTDDYLESKQHKKETKARSALSRELRQLDLSLDEENVSDRRRSSVTGCNNSSFNDSNKRRGRPPRISTEQQPLVTPKLKIKIGNNSIISSTKIDDKKDKIRPPKKRISNIPMPSVEDLKRESMKYRKMVMAGFGEEKKKKKERNEKKKKKKKHEVEIIANDMEKPTKLIIRFNKKVDGEITKRTSVNSDSAKTDQSVTSELPTSVPVVGESSSTSNSRSPPKVTPIKLKLSRCQEGAAYIMKPSIEDHSPTTKEETPTSQPGQPPPPLPTPPSSAELSEVVQPPPDPLPLNKDCEVR